jgi:hypothetical protein
MGSSSPETGGVSCRDVIGPRLRHARGHDLVLQPADPEGIGHTCLAESGSSRLILRVSKGVYLRRARRQP